MLSIYIRSTKESTFSFKLIASSNLQQQRKDKFEGNVFRERA